MHPRRVGRPSPDVQQLDFDGEFSLFDPRTGDALALNRTASDIWALADGVRSVDEVVTVLAEAYTVPRHEIRDQVVSVLRQLEAAGVLEPRSTDR